MKSDKSEKKGFFGFLSEAFRKSGGCCGAGQTCGVPANEKQKVPVPKEVTETGKPPQSGPTPHAE